jgi:signal transduction histidine kinase
MAALSNLRAAIEASGAVVSFGALPAVNINAARIAEVFQNLIGNSIKYRKPGESPVIRISAQAYGGGEWLIVIEDNGMGFEPRYAEQVFGAFKRLHGREIPGTGIGLAICRKLIEAHGGKIWAISAPGIGSRFCFTVRC